MTKHYLNPPSLFDAQPFGFSQIVSCSNGTAYISGQTAWDTEGKLSRGGDFSAQLNAALENLVKAVEAIGGSAADIVRVRLYIVNHVPAYLETVGQTMTKLFGPDALPASTLIGVAQLAVPELLVEIEADVCVGFF
jgi:enamine deaminase RidA (YjgF/YER057c/UK114 family)